MICVHIGAFRWRGSLKNAESARRSGFDSAFRVLGLMFAGTILTICATTTLLCTLRTLLRDKGVVDSVER